MKELEKIVLYAKKGNELYFNKFLKKTFKDLNKQLLLLTKSESESEDIFIEAMQKFWERFVVNDNELPKNPAGYIFTTCKNIWLMKKRDTWNKVILKDSLLDNIKDTSQDEDNVEKDNENDIRERSLNMALQEISPKCRELIQISMDASIKLVDCMSDLGFKTYQALIQAKYNCKKRLVKEVFYALRQLKKAN